MNKIDKELNDLQNDSLLKPRLYSFDEVREIVKTLKNKTIKETEDKYKKEILKILKEPSYIGVLDSNEQRRGYEKAHTEIINLIKNK